MTLSDPAELVPFARWITPAEVKVRYDTWFYLALAPSHSSPEPDGEEIVETAWLTPAEALARHGRGEMLLVFPTIHKLQVLSKYETAEEALAAAREANVEPILPRIDASGDEPRILLPGDWGYSNRRAGGRARTGTQARPRTRSCRAARRPRSRRPRPRVPRTTSRSRPRRTRARPRAWRPPARWGPPGNRRRERERSSRSSRCRSRATGRRRARREPGRSPRRPYR